MTPTPTHCTPTPADTGVVLDPDEAADLARLLDLIEDWLRHTGDARADLAGFLDGAGHGHLAAAGVAATIEQSALSLHRRLKKAHR